MRNVAEVEAEIGAAAAVVVGDLEVVVAAVGAFVGLVVELVVELLMHLDCYKPKKAPQKMSKMSFKTRLLHWWSSPHWGRLQSNWCLSCHCCISCDWEDTNWLICG